MKYFTPELLARYGSPDDQIADAAQAEWEVAAAKYRKHLLSIDGKLPKKLRALQRRYYLHDATVLFVGVADQVLHMTLQLDAPPRDAILLRYRLVSEVQTVTHPGFGHEEGQPLSWQYDELDIVRHGVLPVVEQRILFSNGLEVTIRLQQLSYSTAKSFITAAT